MNRQERVTRVVRSSITRSIKGRLIALHLIAVLAASVMLPLALYWRVDATARGLHERALREQAEQVAHYLRRFPNGSWSLDLPDAVRQLYSDGYERYGFAFFTKSGQVLFSTREHDEPLFGFDPGEAADQPISSATWANRTISVSACQPPLTVKWSGFRSRRTWPIVTC